jgi:hypothetical protein
MQPKEWRNVWSVHSYATIGKLQLFASADVVSKAEKVMQGVVVVYPLPN